MQHGSARPLAVKYMTVHGRRHIDHGEPSSPRLRLMPGSEAAPDALDVSHTIARAWLPPRYSRPPRCQALVKALIGRARPIHSSRNKQGVEERPP